MFVIKIGIKEERRMICIKISKDEKKGYGVEANITNDETLTDCVSGSVYALMELVDKLPNEQKGNFRKVLAQFVNNNYIWYPEGSQTSQYLS